MNNRGIITVIIGVIVLSLGISLHRISSTSSDLQYEFLSKPIAEPSDMESAGDKASGNYGNAEAFDAESSDAILFIERKISSLEACRISAGSIILEIPVGAVSSEKEVTVRGLRDSELPELDFGLVNVTSTYGGYRCLPHGKFNKPLQLSIGYDTLLIPAGYSPRDIRTFFYDEDRMEWVCMPVDSIDQEHQLVVTSTDHFTDFINGILTQPEIPDASGYANTSIRGIEYANPLEGMNIMQAPTANNNGSCSMSFPIQIPAGRNGMAPQISISYSSDVKDGIMGPGWSLNIPSITVDTRWGVPPYSTTDESESYLVNGEAIVESEEDPNTGTITRHKPLYVESGGERGSEKTYAYLKEGKFDKIVRHGDSPQNYWWEVTDRNGVKYIYGDEEQDDQLQYSLAGNAPDNNIAVWGLAKTKDPYGNAVEYFYDIETEDEALEELHPLAKQMRVSEIKYTSLENEGQYEEGKYHVAFEYEEEPLVAQLSGTYGFLTTDNKLLSKITIEYNREFVKCYKFKYEEGVLSKKVLKAIAEITDRSMLNEEIDGTQKQGFYVHTFDYYDENEIAFGDINELNVDFDDTQSQPVSQGLTLLGINNIREYLRRNIGLSNISKNTSYSVAGGGSACVGFNDGELLLKNNTIGANYHYTYDINNEKAQLIDLNGDGIVDRVEKTVVGDMKFYKGKWQNDEPGTIIFERPVSLNSLSKLAKSSSQTHTIGGELLVGYASATAMASYSHSTTKTINSNYFMDVNGDGFVDYVADDDVLLNFPDDNGQYSNVPHFYSMSRSLDMPESSEAKTSYDDCYSFAYGGRANTDEPEDDFEEIKKKRDPVVLWRSPMNAEFDYKIIVYGADNPNISGRMGSTGILWYNADSIYYEGAYKDLPTNPQGWGRSLNVGKGGHVLFHVHPFNEKTSDIFNQFDVVIKVKQQSLPDDLRIVYNNNEDATDANGSKLFKYNYSTDAVIQDGKPFISPSAGTVNWSATLRINHPMSDKLIYSVIYNKYIPESDSYIPLIVGPYDGENNEPRYCAITSNDYTYDENDQEYIYTISANGSLRVEEKDQLYFRLMSNSNVDWGSISFKSNINYESIDNVPEESRDTTTYHPSLDMSIYSQQISMSRPVSLPRGSYSVRPYIDEIIYSENNRGYDIMNFIDYYINDDVDVYLTVKSVNNLIAKIRLNPGQDNTLSFDIDDNYLEENEDHLDVYFDYTVNGEVNLIEEEVLNINNCKVEVINTEDVFAAGFYAKYPDNKLIFGNLYRGWGQFSYKDTNSGNNPEAYPIPFKELKVDSPIEPEEIENQINSLGRTLLGLRASRDYAQNLENFINQNINTDDIRAMLNPMFEPMHVDVVKGKWIDNSNSVFVNRSSIGCLNSNRTIMDRFNEIQNQNQSNGIAESGDGLPNFSSPFGSRRFPFINKVSKTISNSISASAGVSISSVGYNNTKTETFGLGDMMDMNGDGYPDIVKTKTIQYTLPNGDMSDNIFTFEGDDDVYTNHNKGKLESANTSVSFKPVTLKEKGTNTKSTEKNIKTTAGLGLGQNNTESENNMLKNYIDVNSDGLPDIVTFAPITGEINVEYNLGYKFSSSFPLATIDNVSRSLSNSTNCSLPLCFNKGNYSISGGAGANKNESKSMGSMMDINSDGLVDIVSASPSNTLSVRLNKGNGFGDAITVNVGTESLSDNKTFNISANGSGSFGFPITYIKIVGSLYADLSYSFNNEKLRFMDVNGDGAIDILEVRDNGISVQYGKPQKRNLLKKVTTPALGEYEMAYSMLYPDIDNPNRKWIMSELSVYDNDGDFADGSDELHYQFEYSGMKYHRIERESYGFAEVTTKIVDQENNVLRKQKEYYITENGLRHGLKYKDEVLDDRDNLQTSTDYNWTLNDLNTGIVVEESECGSEQEVYPRLESELTTVYGIDQSNTLVSKKSYVYTKYGNISQYVSKYNPDELVKAEMDYYSPDEFGEHRFLDKIKVMTVKSASDAVIRKMSREYDNYGDITKVDNYIDERTYASTDFEYDMYGNLVKATYPENGGGHRAYTTYEYDDIHTYLSSVTEASGVTTQLTQYDYRFGKPTVVIAPNGTRTVYTYYSDGKIKTIKAPTDENQEYSLKFEYWDELRNQSPRWARVIHKDRFIDGNTFVTHTICDGLGRTMLNARKAVVDGEVRYVVSGKNVYDDYGRVISSYQPAEVSREDDCLSARFENPTKYKYDCLDRVTKTTTPDDKTIEKSYNVSIDVMGNQAMLVTTTYPLSREQITYTDSRGLQTATVQASESGNITTTFEYSPMGELISSKDPEGAVTKYKYDMLGHLVWRCHPDAGETTFFYDNAGNLIAKATQELINSGLSIKYEYDEYNRLKKILYPDNQDMNVYYEYGRSNDGLNAGLVTKRQDGVSLQTYSYNEMGDLIENVRNFATPDRQLMTFKTRWKYDTWGRVFGIEYPDQDLVEYKYDLAGKVIGMIKHNETIVEDIRYDKYGNRTSVKYGNGTHNHYEYDPLSLQLSRMRSFATDVVLQDVHYEYDDVYNIIGINNDGEFHYRYDYMYDRLNRLVKSDGQSALDAGYHFEMTYSPAGKIMDYILTGRNNINGEIFDIDRSDSYIYDNQQQPHTVTHIGPDKYLWDANGNIKRRIGNGARRPEVREHYFNEENRLAAISDGLVDEEGRPIYEPGVRETVAAYLYDAGGERVWKFSGIVTDAYRNERRVSRDLELDKTFYPTQHITLDNRNLYKHYFIGDERISTEVCRYDERQFTQQAHRIILLDGNEREFSEKVIKQVKRALAHVGYEDPFEFNRGDYSHPEQEKFFYHYNHQGSVAALTNRHGEFYQHLQYLPYGDVFVDKHDGSSFTSPYTFSAKEKDSESGYNYFGARYYTDNIMMWLSVDPMSDERSWISPYNYCQWNPIGRVDTWGMLDDWYKTANGEIMYKEEMHSDEEMKAMGIQGTYLGKTYKEGSTYYSLFGHQMDLSTWKGRFYEAMDEALKSHAEYVTAPIDPNDPEPRQEPTVDFGVAKYKNSFMENNKYQVEYEDGKGYYQVFGNDKAMKGSLEFGKLKYNANKNYGFAITEPGYNVYVKNKNDAAIVQLVFPDLESRVNFYNKWANEFQIKK